MLKDGANACIHACLFYTIQQIHVRARAFLQLCSTLGQFSLHSLLNSKPTQIYDP